MKIQLYYSYLPASQLFKESMDILMSPEPSTSTQNHEVCVDLPFYKRRSLATTNKYNVYRINSIPPKLRTSIYR